MMLVFLVAFGLFALTSLRDGRISRESGAATLIRYGRIWIITALGLGCLSLVAAAAPWVLFALAGLLAAFVGLRFLLWLYSGTV